MRCQKEEIVKEKMVYALLFLFWVALAGAPALYAEEDDSGASGQAQEVAPVPSTFDGGEGTTLNEDSGQNSGSRMPHVKKVMSQDDNGGSNPSTFDGGEGATLNEDSGQNSGSRMPHVKKVMSQDDTGESDPSAFEGDSDSKPGERAPENLPMDDAPVDAGIGLK
jgi:hypothetical protein